MILLTTSEIVSLHSKLIAKTGGVDGLRDLGLLDSAVSSALNAFGDFEQYPTVEEKAARLAYAIVSNHAFVDGNKRIGVLVMLMTLRLNKVTVTFTQEELTELGLGIASGMMQYEDILKWVMGHKS